MKKLVYQNENGGCSVVVPSPKWQGTEEELAAKDVPAGSEFLAVDDSDIPQSRNWRDAWELSKNGKKVRVNLKKARKAHKRLMVQKGLERAPRDMFGQPDLTEIKQQIEAIDLEAITTLDDLFNVWPEKVNTRKTRRKYQEHADKA